MYLYKWDDLKKSGIYHRKNQEHQYTELGTPA